MNLYQIETKMSNYQKFFPGDIVRSSLYSRKQGYEFEYQTGIVIQVNKKEYTNGGISFKYEILRTGFDNLVSFSDEYLENV